jgi:hypothetical protein
MLTYAEHNLVYKVSKNQWDLLLRNVFDNGQHNNHYYYVYTQHMIHPF